MYSGTCAYRLSVSYGGSAALSRYARTGLLDVIRADYIRIARKGSSGGVVIIKHVARNGMIPIITLMSHCYQYLSAAPLSSKSSLASLVRAASFSQAFCKRTNAVMVVLLISSLLTLIGMLLADLTYALVDPASLLIKAIMKHTQNIMASEPEDLSFSDIVWQQLRRIDSPLALYGYSAFSLRSRLGHRFLLRSDHSSGRMQAVSIFHGSLPSLTITITKMALINSSTSS